MRTLLIAAAALLWSLDASADVAPDSSETVCAVVGAVIGIPKVSTSAAYAPREDADGNFTVCWSASANSEMSLRPEGSTCFGKWILRGYSLEANGNEIYFGSGRKFRLANLPLGTYAFRSHASYGGDGDCIDANRTKWGPYSNTVTTVVTGEQDEVGTVVSTVHGTVTSAAGCYPEESDTACIERRAAETEAAVLTLIDGVKDQARSQARALLGCQSWETDEQCAVRVANEKVTYVGGVAIDTAEQAIALFTATEQMAEGMVRTQLGCQSGETNETCAQRVASTTANGAVATADAAVRQQLQCQPGETTDGCAVRVVNQTALGAYNTVHGPAASAAGCYPGESDAVCAQRRAAETQAALLTLINGVKDAARNQARTTLGCQSWETDDQCAVRVGNEKTVFVTDTLITTANQVLAIIQGAEQLAEATVRNALGCQAGESNEACVVRVANKAIADPIGTVVRLINDLI